MEISYGALELASSISNVLRPCTWLTLQHEKRSSEMVKQVKQLADDGHFESLFWIAQSYHYGRDANRNYQKAFTWYHQAAQCNHRKDVEAMHQLGYMYGNGMGTPKKVQEAIVWYSMAAERGFTLSLYELGKLYMRGTDGMQPNTKEAMKCLLKAANGGYAYAQYEYGKCLLKGLDHSSDKSTNQSQSTINYKEALKWLVKSISVDGRKPTRAVFELTRLLLSGHVARNDHWVMSNLRNNADIDRQDGGRVWSQCWLAWCYATQRVEEGDHMEPGVNHIELAKSWYQIAHLRGHSHALKYLNMLKSNPIVIPPQPEDDPFG